MRPRAALLAVVLAVPTAPAANAGQMAAPTDAAPAASAAPAPASAPPATPPGSDIARIKRRLDTGTPLLDAALTSPPPTATATFRASVTERFDIWKYWGEPDAVAAYVRPRGGPWHQEFQNMVTPDAFKGYGGILGNSEKLQLAATSLAVAGAMKLLGIGVKHARDAAQTRAKREAQDEVRRELEAFYALHPEARPTTPLPPP